MASNVQNILRDSRFLGLPDEEKRKVLQQVDSNFRGLPSPEQDRVLSGLGGMNKPEPPTPPAAPALPPAPKPISPTPARGPLVPLPAAAREEAPEQGPALRFPARTGISALPRPGLLARAKEAVLGGVRTGETMLGQAAQVLTGQRPLMAVQPAPVLRPEAAVVEPKSRVGQIARGALRGVGELTSPENVLMLGGIGGAVRGIGRLGMPWLQRAISAGFAGDMIHGLYAREPEFREAAERGDEGRAWELLGELAVGGAMASGAGVHAVRGTRLRPGLPERPVPAMSPERPRLRPVEPRPIEPAPPAPQAQAGGERRSSPEGRIDFENWLEQRHRLTHEQLMSLPAERQSDIRGQYTHDAQWQLGIRTGSRPTLTPQTPEPSPSPMPVPPTKLPPVPAPQPAGAPSSLRTTAGDFPVRYRVVEADSLQTSHDPFTFSRNPRYPEGVQERLYESNKSAQMDVIRMAESPRWDLVANTDPTPVNGPPQITPEGIVLGGNSRTMMLKRAYLSGRGQEYKEFIESQAQQFGIDPQSIRGMQKPVLVRELEGVPAEAEGMRRLAQSLNRGFTKALGEIESAVSAGKNLTAQSAEAIVGELTKGGDAATLRTAMESNPKLFRDVLLRDGLIQENDLPRFFTEHGALNQAGKDFIEHALLGRIVPDADLLQSLPKSLTAKLERTIPSLIELGSRQDKWNIVSDVLEAARMTAQAQAKGWSIDKFTRQRGMFEQPNERVAAIAQLLTEKPTLVADVFRRFAGEARQDTGRALFEGAFDPLESFGRLIQGRRPVSETAPAFVRRQQPGRTAAPALPVSLAPSIPQQPLVRRGDIVSRLRERLGGIPIRTGLLGKRTPGLLGFYKVGPEIVRLKEALDLPTISHEVGHHINKMLWGTTRGGGLNTRVLRQFSKELAPLSYDPAKPLLEGFPEFVRLYLTEPNNARARAPQFYAFFENELGRVKGLKEAVTEAQSQIQLYQRQPSVAKVLAHIRKDAPAPQRNVWDRFYTGVVDQLTPIRRAVEDMAGRLKPPTDANAYDLARLHAGWVGKAEHFLKRGTFEPESLKVTGRPLEAILKPVSGRLDEFRAYLVSRRAIELANQGKKSGIELGDATAAVRSLERTPEFRQAADELFRYQDSLLQYIAQSGFLSGEQVALIKNLNRNYVPFHRFFEDVWAKEPAGTGKQKFADLWQPVKRLKGSTREIIDPLESVVKNTYAFINLAERNRVAQALIKQARTTEGAGKWVEPIPMGKKPTSFSLEEIRRQLEDAGLDLENADLDAIATVFRGTKPHGENVLSVWQKGKPAYYEVHPELFRAMKALDAESSNILIRLLSMPARALRLGATGLGPEFVIRNPIRDAGTAFMQSKHGFIPGWDTARGVFHVLGRDDLFWEWRRAGGEHAAMVSLDRTQLQGELRDLLSTKMRWAARHPIEALRVVSETMEAATRVGEFGRARQAGATPREAALASREVTLDFARMGASTRAVNAITAFWNAAVQGTDKFARTHIENPRRAMALGAAGITLPSLLLYAVNRNDPVYQELPPWMKNFFWLIPTRGTPAAKHTPFIPIPKPFLWGLVYGSVPERTMEWIDKRDPQAFDGLLENLSESSKPGFLPTAAIPFVQAFANRSTFTGRPIESARLRRLPPEFRYESWTTEFSKSMSKALNNAGIDSVGGIPTSPLMIEQAVFAWTGGAGRAAMEGVSATMARDVPRPSRTAADIPGLRAFALRWPTTQAESVQRFYDRLEDLERRFAGERASQENPDLPEGKPLSQDELAELYWLRANGRRMASLRSELRRVQESLGTPSQQKRERIDALTNEMLQITREAMQPEQVRR